MGDFHAAVTRQRQKSTTQPGAKRLGGLTVQASALKRKGCCSQRSRGGPPPDTDGRRRTLSLLPNNTEADAFRRLRVR